MMRKTPVCPWFIVRDQIVTSPHSTSKHHANISITSQASSKCASGLWGGGSLVIAESLFDIYSAKHFMHILRNISGKYLKDTLENAGDLQLRTLMDICWIFQCRSFMHCKILPRIFMVRYVYPFNWVYIRADAGCIPRIGPVYSML